MQTEREEAAMNTHGSETQDKDAGAGDYVDPNPPTSKRLARKNVIALALTVVGLLLVLFLSSRGGRSTGGGVSVRPEPGHLGRAPIEIGVPEQDIAPSMPQPSPWANASPYAQKDPVASEPTVDPRQQHYEQALRARPVLNVSGSRASEDSIDDARRGEPAHTRSSVSAQGELLSSSPSERSGTTLNDDRTTIHLAKAGDFAVAQGTVIEAAMVTAINSDRPGPVIAHVTHPVYDSKNMQHLLIPPGTRLIGQLDQALEGQDRRVVLAWTRMIFPDGRSLDLPGFPAIETRGEGGLRDRVNLHMASLFGRAALVALLGGTTTYAASQANGQSAIGPGTFLGASLGLELSRMATAMLQQGLRRRPTVTIRAGYRFLVYVAHDLRFEAPYEEIPSPPRFAAPTF